MYDLTEMIRQYEAEKRKWKKAGKPIRSKEEMAKIYAICSQCPLFKPKGGFLPGYDQCGICGCNLHKSAHKLNKIAWATTNCPDSPSRWGPDIKNKAPDSSSDDIK